jgi:hypothetical protein
MPKGYEKLKAKYGNPKAAKIWNAAHKGTGQTVGKGQHEGEKKGGKKGGKK